jgi:hypothetical protein
MSNYNDINNPNYNSNINPNINQNPDNNFISNMTNENFVNMASSIDLDNLNGTNIMDLGRDTLTTLNNLPLLNTMTSFNNMPSFNNNSQLNNAEPMKNIQTFNNLPPMNHQNNNPMIQDKHLIKSITRELINNLKENNISLHDDNTTYNSNFTKKSNKNKMVKTVDDFDYSNGYHDNFSDNINDNISDQDGSITKHKKSKKLYEYKDDLKKGFEHMMNENGVPTSSSVSSYIFDDLFNLKEFIILFGVYFLLSQEMVKDLFAQYFTSLNADDSGRVHVKGVIIYGLILTILFMVLKKLL